MMYFFRQPLVNNISNAILICVFTGRFPDGFPEGSLALKSVNVKLLQFRKVPEGFRKVSRKAKCKR